MIYLDNASTTMLSTGVYMKMSPWLQGGYNAGGLHSRGREAREAVENAREQVAKLINCEPSQIIFTSGGSESNNMVINAATGDRVAVSATEHDSIINSTLFGGNENFISPMTKSYSRRDRVLIPVDSNGICTVAECAHVLSALRPGLISVMYANNEVNAVNPVKEIAAEAHKQGCYFHTDCVQALGYYDLDMQEIGCDFASFSSHKIHGPQGVGALYVKNPHSIYPLIFGSEQQEYGLRGGTENVAGIVGFGEACRAVLENKDKCTDNIDMQKAAFWEALYSHLGDKSCVHINGLSRGKVFSLRFDGVDGQSLVLMLNKHQIFVSTGSACNSMSTNPSHVLTAMGLSQEEARSTIRVSFDPFAEDMIDDASEAGNLLAACVNILRKV